MSELPDFSNVKEIKITEHRLDIIFVNPVDDIAGITVNNRDVGIKLFGLIKNWYDGAINGSGSKKKNN